MGAHRTNTTTTTTTRLLGENETVGLRCADRNKEVFMASSGSSVQDPNELGASPKKSRKRNRTRNKWNKAPAPDDAGSGGATVQTDDKPQLVPSVQKLFDSIEISSLKITVSGDTRIVTETPAVQSNRNSNTAQPEAKGKHKAKQLYQAGNKFESKQTQSSLPPQETNKETTQSAESTGNSRLDAINANPDPTNAQKKYRKKMDRYLENKLKKLRDKHETDSAAPDDADVETDKADAKVGSINLPKISDPSVAPLSKSSQPKSKGNRKKSTPSEEKSEDVKVEPINSDALSGERDLIVMEDVPKSVQGTDMAKYSDDIIEQRPNGHTPATPKQRTQQLQLFFEEYTAQVGLRYIVELDDDHIRILRKKSTKFPDAKFFCRLCEYHVDLPEKMEEHRNGDGHNRRKRLKSGNALLRFMPPPTKSHLEALTSYLESFYEEIVLPDEESVVRKSVVDELEKDLHTTDDLTDVTLQVCGSVRSGFALKESDTNIRIVAPKTANLAIVMKGIYDTLLKSDEKYSEVKKNFGARQPYVSFQSCQAVGVFVLKYSEEGNLLTNMLLSCYSKYSKYSKCDTKLKKLVVLLKYLAKISHIDDYEKGALFPYCYPLMTIYYCQQQDFIPVFFDGLDLEGKSEAELQGEIDKLEPQKTRRDIDLISLGQHWLAMLKYYCLTFNIEDHVISIMSRRLVKKSTKSWATKRLTIEDPGIPKRNICKTVSHQRVFDFVHDQLRTGFQYFATPQLESGPAFTKLLIPDSGDKKSKPIDVKIKPGSQAGKNGKSAGQVYDEIISDNLSRLDINSSSKESTDPKVNLEGAAGETTDDGETSITVEKSDNATPVSDERYDRALDTGHSKSSITSPAIESSSGDDDTSQNVPTLRALASRQASITTEQDALAASSPKQANKSTTISEGGSKSQDITDSAAGSVETEAGDSQSADSGQASEKAESDSLVDVEPPTDDLHELVYDEELVQSLTTADYQFDFTSKYMKVKDAKLPIFCRACSKANHLSVECPDEQLPACVPLPPPSNKHREVIVALLKDIKDQIQMNHEDEQNRKHLLEELTDCVQQTFPESRLCLYGSSRNGFGNANSDVDICMTLDGVEWIDPTETVDIIINIAKTLYRLPHITSIVPLAHAKVPIVKFYSKKYDLECDLSLYNILAQRNTMMLYRYSQIDERVRTLGYCVKEFAKQCDMGDASRGSLSSYAYMIMMIHYLQQCEPPVLPVLQELYEGKKPEYIVEDWDTWFFEGDNKKLRKVWPGMKKNDKDEAQLWIGFLDYYAQKFQYKTDVVTIRMGRTLSKFEKLWNSDTLAIEDPFDLKRNLGSALSKKMNTYILSNIIRGRAIFASTMEDIPRGYQNWYKYFFANEEIFKEGGAPNDRGCRICGKIGHIAKGCPVTQNRKNTKQRKLDEKRRAEAKRNALENREMERRKSENERRSTSSDNGGYAAATPPRVVTAKYRNQPSREHRAHHGSPQQTKQQARQHFNTPPHSNNKQQRGGQRQTSDNPQKPFSQSARFSNNLAFPSHHQNAANSIGTQPGAQNNHPQPLMQLQPHQYPQHQQQHPLQQKQYQNQQQQQPLQPQQLGTGPVPAQYRAGIVINNSSLPANLSQHNTTTRR